MLESNISIGIMAYNEEENIGILLEWLTKNYKRAEIIVVASGCTDNTVQIAKSFKSIIVIEQKERKGKASAINIFLEVAKGHVMVLESADTVPGILCIEKLVNALEGGIAISGAHTIPTDSKSSTANKIGNIIWEICHYLSLEKPKLGEMICFKNVVRSIDGGTSVDEAVIQNLITKWGYKAVYVPDAIVYNKTCDNLRDLVNQRKRIYKGHLQLKQKGYSVSSMNILTVLKATLKAWQSGSIRAILLETYCRIKAWQEFKCNNKEETIWERCQTTKALVKQ